MKRILFYASIEDTELFQLQKFYVIDKMILNNLNYSVTTTNKMSDFICFWKYDIGFFYFYTWSLFPALLSKIYRKKIIFTGGIDNLDINHATKKSYIIQKYFFKLCYKIAKKIIIVSTTDLNNIKKIYPPKKTLDKIELSYHTIDTETLDKDILKNKEKKFLTIGWLGEDINHNIKRKGIDKTIYIFNELIKYEEYADYQLYIIGKGNKGRDVLNEIINDLKLNHKVHLLGGVDEQTKKKWLAKSEYYCQFSSYEGFGISALEALFYKNVVLHSGKGGLSDTIKDFGRVYNIDDSYNSIAKKIYNDNKQISFKEKEKILEISNKYILNNFSIIKRQEIFKVVLT